VDNSIQDWLWDYRDVILLAIMLLSLCGIVVSVEYLWNALFPSYATRLWFGIVKDQWYRFVKNPISRLLQPLHRMHSKWSARRLRVQMAKWKKEYVAAIFYDGLSQACEEGIISKHIKRKLMKDLADFFQMSDLVRASRNRKAIAHRIQTNETYKFGPVQDKPAWGGKPGEDVVPIYKHEGLGSKFLKKKGNAA